MCPHSCTRFCQESCFFCLCTCGLTCPSTRFGSMYPATCAWVHSSGCRRLPRLATLLARCSSPRFSTLSNFAAWCSGYTSAPHARLSIGLEFASLHFDLLSRYIPVAVYAAAHLKRKFSFSDLARCIRERSVAAARWTLQPFKSNRGSSTIEMKNLM